MSIPRLKTLIQRSIFHFTHSMESWVDLFWNSSLQMALFALIARSIQTSSGALSESGIYIVVGMVLWNIIWAVQYDVAIGALWEIWSRSFSSLFITPVTIGEFLVAQLITGTIKGIASVAVVSVVSYVFYQFTVLSLGWMLPVYFLELAIFGWSIGLLVLALIFHKGTEVQSISWAFVFLIQPLGGVFYPASVLPEWIRPVLYVMPTSYIFDSIRYQLIHGTPLWDSLAIGTAVNLVYVVISIVIMRWSYGMTKRSGAFARMES